MPHASHEKGRRTLTRLGGGFCKLLKSVRQLLEARWSRACASAGVRALTRYSVKDDVMSAARRQTLCLVHFRVNSDKSTRPKHAFKRCLLQRRCSTSPCTQSSPLCKRVVSRSLLSSCPAWLLEEWRSCQGSACTYEVSTHPTQVNAVAPQRHC